MTPNFSKIILYNHHIKNIANFFINNHLLYKSKIYHFFLNKKISQITKKYKNKPAVLRIENTNICNARCYMCPHSSMKRPMGTMTREIYQKIVDEAVKLEITTINLHNFGEPLVDKDLIWRIKYAKKVGIKNISTNTNGQLLTPKLSKEIINSKLDKIFFSIDAASPKTHQKIRIGLDYKTVTKNINFLTKTKKQLKSSTPEIIVDFLKTDINKHEVSKFINYWKNKVDNVCISQIHDWTNKKNNITKFNYQNFTQFSQTPCCLPFTEMVVNWNGDICLCCVDTEGEIILGNVKDESLQKIWTNQKYQQIRKKQLLLKTNNLPLCQNCKLRAFWWNY